MRRSALALLSLALSACAPEVQGHLKVIIGAVMIDGKGGPPLSNSVVVFASDRIRAAGANSDVPIPGDADRIDGSGKVLVPALIDISSRPDPPGTLRPSSPEEARAQVSALISQKPAAIHIGKLPSGIAGAVLEAARDVHIPVTAHIETQAEVRFLVDKGAAVLVGMIRDTEELDPTLLAKLRDLRVVVAPSLSNSAAALDIAKRNTKRMFQFGIPLGLASQGADPIHEAELMAEAGVPPLDVIVAATHNGAVALHQEDRGTIEADRHADLLLLSANPAEDIKNLRSVALRIVGGEFAH